MTERKKKKEQKEWKTWFILIFKYSTQGPTQDTLRDKNKHRIGHKDRIPGLPLKTKLISIYLIKLKLKNKKEIALHALSHKHS